MTERLKRPVTTLSWCRLGKDAFIFKVGNEFWLNANTYDDEICDVCGKKRKCYWLESADIKLGTGFDCCRECLSEVVDDWGEAEEEGSQ